MGLADLSEAEATLVAALQAQGMDLPDQAHLTIEGVTVDLAYTQRRGAIVFATADAPAPDTFALLMAGWNVVTVPPGAAPEDIISANPRCSEDPRRDQFVQRRQPDTGHPVFTVGSFGSRPRREWVVQPDSSDELLVLQPLGGGADDIAGVLPGVEPVQAATFPPPSPEDLADDRSARLLRDALRIGFRSPAGPSGAWPASR